MARITVIVVDGRSIERRKDGRVGGKGEEERPDAAENSAEKAGKGFSTPPERGEGMQLPSIQKNPSLPLPLCNLWLKYH